MLFPSFYKLISSHSIVIISYFSLSIQMLNFNKVKLNAVLKESTVKDYLGKVKFLVRKKLTDEGNISQNYVIW